MEDDLLPSANVHLARNNISDHIPGELVALLWIEQNINIGTMGSDSIENSLRIQAVFGKEFSKFIVTRCLGQRKAHI